MSRHLFQRAADVRWVDVRRGQKVRAVVCKGVKAPIIPLLDQPLPAYQITIAICRGYFSIKLTSCNLEQHFRVANYQCKTTQTSLHFGHLAYRALCLWHLVLIEHEQEFL